MTYETVQIHLEVDTGNDAVVHDPMNALADIFETQLVQRLRDGCDYATIRDANGNTIGSWNLFLDGEGGNS